MNPVIWMTGLPGVGKTEAANAVVARLRIDGESCLLLDGDSLRQVLAPLLVGYDVVSRRCLAETYANLAGLVAGQGTISVVATVSLFADIHTRNRARFAPYLEVLLTCDEAEREGRRPLADLGSGPQVGVDIAPEWPVAPDLRIDTGHLTAAEIGARVVTRWQALVRAR